jgi:hypothetical protein
MPHACRRLGREQITGGGLEELQDRASSKDGEFDTSITTAAPARASASPSPVSVFTPEFGDAASVSCPDSRSPVTSFDPISPLPPMTTIFMMSPLLADGTTVALARRDRLRGNP